MSRNLGGVSAIVAASICLYVGISMLSPTLAGERLALIVGILEFLGFAFGLIAGVFALRGKMFRFALGGMVLTMAAGPAILLPVIIYRPYLAFGMLVTFGILIILLATLGMIFTAMFKREFVS